MEKNSTEKFPECVKNLLLAAGFDTLLSLSQITDTKITTAEHFLTANKHHIFKLDCCYSDEYKNLSEFQFLPGHKTLIMSIPEKVSQIKKTTNESAYQDDFEYEEVSNANRNSVRTSLATSRRSNKRKVWRSAHEIKIQLIRNLDAFLGKIGAQFPNDFITEACIHDFKRDTDEPDLVYRCFFICPFCSKSIPVTHKKFWMSSNATGHLKWHAKNEWKNVELPQIYSGENFEQQF